MSERFEVVSAGGGVEIVDHHVRHWVTRVEPVQPPAGRRIPTSPTALAFGRSLAEQFPAVSQVARQTGYVRVVFSPDARKALAQGSYSYLNAAKGPLPVAVDASGRFREIGTVVGGAGARGLSGVSMAALFPAMLPIAIASAAASAQQHWLEKTLREISAAVERIEERLQDDDYGALEAADGLVTWITTDDRFPDHLRLELAVARREVERIYASRRRVGRRVLTAVKQAQGQERLWTGEIIAMLTSQSRGVELDIYLASILVRARAAACTAGYLAHDGEAQMAMQLIDQLDQDVRQSYDELYETVEDLSRYSPPKGWRDKIPVESSQTRAFESAKRLRAALDETTGQHLSETDAPPMIVLPATALASSPQ